MIKSYSFCHLVHPSHMPHFPIQNCTIQFHFTCWDSLYLVHRDSENLDHIHKESCWKGPSLSPAHYPQAYYFWSSHTSVVSESKVRLQNLAIIWLLDLSNLQLPSTAIKLPSQNSKAACGKCNCTEKSAILTLKWPSNISRNISCESQFFSLNIGMSHIMPSIDMNAKWVISWSLQFGNFNVSTQSPIFDGTWYAQLKSYMIWIWTGMSLVGFYLEEY